ncbi:hypothetical protein DSD19_00505 [Rhodovulum sp. BSW8]|uniref:hypothetical protein n=1 Tax=Rhodovulum sp. BSW8 TaxID=2259645 RepID=UPI000DE56794|nr:hypothetical protein [Rhodovulum sp. BSW8]RBO55157.1 hypothetical protein DSD19_00505 [Rhodovulum sp. BSW8]
MTALKDISAAPLAILQPRPIVLPGGALAIHCFSDLDAPAPEAARPEGDAAPAWAARFWQADGRWHGLAVLGAATLGPFALTDASGAPVAEVGTPASVATEAAALAAHLRETGAPVAELVQFLDEAFEASGSEAAQRFQTDLLRETSQADGFVELVVRPDCGGLFLQGWAHSSLTGPLSLLGQAAGVEAVAAVFRRDDILAPAAGFCIFVKDWAGRLDGCKVLFVEHEGGLLRLDLVPDAPAPITGADATEHVRAMLPRLAASGASVEPFKRIVRPRFDGRNTLAEHPGPTTAAIDRILRTPAGGIFVTGWLLDPLDRVERVILKTSANLYAPLHDRWHRTDRPDLNDAFAPDPRFQGLIDPRERLHGFVCAVSAPAEKLDGTEAYLELVMKDDGCLFLPVELTPCDGPGAAHPVFSALQPHDPALGSLISDHAAPFLASLPRRGAPNRLTVQPLAGGPAGRTVAAVMPVTDLAHLHPVMACLAGQPEASELDLILVAGREGAARLAEELDHQFRFFGLTGALVLVPDHETLAGRLDAGAAASDAPEILVWQTSVLPKSPGWLDRLRAGAAGLPGAAVVSPMLCYEDGSVYFGGSEAATPPRGAVCALVGFERHRIADGAPRPAAAIPAEIALIARAALDQAGGFRGGLWGDRFIGQDLTLRLARSGARPWCDPSAEFWMLDAAPPQGDPARRELVDRVDAALIALQRRRAGGPHLAPVGQKADSKGDRT